MKKDIITGLATIAAIGAIFWSVYVISLLLERIF